MTTDGAVQIFNKRHTHIHTHHVVSHPPLGSEGDGESRTAIASSPRVYICCITITIPVSCIVCLFWLHSTLSLSSSGWWDIL